MTRLFVFASMTPGFKFLLFSLLYVFVVFVIIIFEVHSYLFMKIYKNTKTYKEHYNYFTVLKNYIKVNKTKCKRFLEKRLYVKIFLLPIFFFTIWHINLLFQCSDMLIGTSRSNTIIVSPSMYKMRKTRCTYFKSTTTKSTFFFTFSSQHTNVSCQERK